MFAFVTLNSLPDPLPPSLFPRAEEEAIKTDVQGCKINRLPIRLFSPKCRLSRTLKVAPLLHLQACLFFHGHEGVTLITRFAVEKKRRNKGMKEGLLGKDTAVTNKKVIRVLCTICAQLLRADPIKDVHEHGNSDLSNI